MRAAGAAAFGKNRNYLPLRLKILVARSRRQSAIPDKTIDGIRLPRRFAAKENLMA
jgi:hypothetical protein